LDFANRPAFLIIVADHFARRLGECPVDRLPEFIPLAELPKHLPPGRNGKRLHKSVPFRWATNGLRGVRLPFVQVGGRRCTTLPWVNEFFVQLTTLASDHAAAEIAQSTGLAEAKAAGERLRSGVFRRRSTR
jgi:hypothetical protein